MVEASKEEFVEGIGRAVHRRRQKKRALFRGKVNAPVLHLGKINFLTKFMDGSKHLGIFPEQKPHWDWIFPLRTVLHVIIWKIFGIRNGK